MNVTDLFTAVNTAAISFGMVRKENDISRGNTVIRKNIEPSAFQDDAKDAYFGYISAEEGFSGRYSDLSLVVFPQKDEGVCVVALAVGSEGFSNDYPLAQFPGLRRSFLRLMSDDGKSFCKTTFTDIASSCRTLPEIESSKDDPYANLRNQIETYKTVILASRILNPDAPEDMKMLKAWLATYAFYRDWAKTRNQVKAIKEAITNCIKAPTTDELAEIRQLLKQRHFVVLQGAPGTGKCFAHL